MSQQYEAIVLDTINLKPVFWIPADKAGDMEFLGKLPKSIQDFDVIETPKDLEKYKQTEQVKMCCNLGQHTERVRDKTEGAKKVFGLMQAMSNLKEFTGRQTKSPIKEKSDAPKTRKSDGSKAYLKAVERIREWYQAMKDDPTNANKTRMSRSDMVTKLTEEFGIKESTAGQYIQHARTEHATALPEATSTRQLAFDCVKVSLFMNTDRAKILADIQEKFGLTENTAKNYYQKARQEYLNEKR
jgi:predicted solute-binding protein